MTIDEIEEIKAMIQDLRARSAEHDQIQKRLDTLLERVFAGPSEAFPEEDHAETEVYAVEKEYKEVSYAELLFKSRDCPDIPISDPDKDQQPRTGAELACQSRHGPQAGSEAPWAGQYPSAEGRQFLD